MQAGSNPRRRSCNRRAFSLEIPGHRRETFVPVCLFALIGGCIFPWEMMPDNAKTLAFLTPQGWALDAFREIMPSSFDTTTDFQLIWKSTLVLSAMGFILIIITWITLGRIRFGNS